MEEIIWIVVSNLVLGLLICLFGWSQTTNRLARALRSRLQVLAGRWWGTYHGFLRGTYWESNEHELFRVDIDAVSVFAIDGHTDVEQNATCIVTDHRLMVCDPKGTMVQIPLAAIRATHAQRKYDRDTGFTYAVAIDLGRTSDHDPHGDLWLRCATDRMSHDLASSIDDAVGHLEHP